MKVCPKCGFAVNNDDESYCPNCTASMANIKPELVGQAYWEKGQIISINVKNEEKIDWSPERIARDHVERMRKEEYRRRIDEEMAEHRARLAAERLEREEREAHRNDWFWNILYFFSMLVFWRAMFRIGRK